MADGFVPEVVVSNQLDRAKAEIFSFIESNAEAIDENFPVFFGKIVTLLDRAGVPIPDAVTTSSSMQSSTGSSPSAGGQGT